MTVKTVNVWYKGKATTERAYRVRFFNSKTTAVKEAQRLNAGGSLRKGDK